MIPTGRALGALAVWCALAVVASVWPSAAPAWTLGAGVLLVSLVVDGWRVLVLPLPGAMRIVPPSLSQGERAELRLRIHNRAGRPVHGAYFDHAPVALGDEGGPGPVRLPAQGFAEVARTVRPRERGWVSLGPVDLRLRSGWGLWWRQVRLDADRRVRVLPNVQRLAQLDLPARRLAELGIHRRRRPGDGSELLQLRPYRVGDSMRQIYWRATSKLGKVISREYEEERDQRVVFLVDHGRRMRSRDGDRSHLDHALEAMLLLSWVALGQGDAVGAMTCGSERRWVAPRKGVGHVQTLLGAMFDLQADLGVPDLEGVIGDLLGRVSKRSFVILLTNLRDDAPDALSPVLSLARRRHAVLVASLREQALGDLLASEPVSHDEALTWAAGVQILRERQRALAALRATGIQCLDVEPRSLGSALVQHYLAWRAAGG